MPSDPLLCQKRAYAFQSHQIEMMRGDGVVDRDASSTEGGAASAAPFISHCTTVPSA